MSVEVWDVLVVGAGAAGLVAAFRAAELGASVLLLEKNRRPGVKILMSGGTRCNLTHDTDNRGIVQAYGVPGRFLHSALAALSVRASIQLFEAEGVYTKAEETGKVFPQSDRAADVLEALLDRFKRSGATLATEEPLLELQLAESQFIAKTTRREIRVRRVIVTTGGQSYPGSGTTGDGYRFATTLGHGLIPPRPALVPLTTHAAWVLDLKGITLPDVTLSVWEKGKRLAQRRSSLLFAHFGLTGPAALDVSRVVSGHARPSDLVAEVDLLPDLNEERVVERWRESLADAGRKTLATLLGQWFPQRIADVVLAQAGVPPDRKAAEHGKEERQRIAHTIKRLPIPLSGTLGFKKAEVTAGGVPLEEVDSRTMQSKRVPGLYFAGEVLDLDGPIGGYNFQAAWSTGWLAGSSAAESAAQAK
ncbi:MAG: NAD(P)/FAD-dependent oxidoreductase [Pirellulales bacterium]